MMDRHRRIGGPALAALLAGSVAACCCGRARAQTSLYPDRLPDGYAYIRFVNTSSEPVTVKPVGFGEAVSLGTEGAARVSAYRVVENVAGRKMEVDMTSGGRDGRGAFTVEPGSFDTVLVEPGLDLATVKDEAEISQTRARLAFYNAAPGCVAAGLQLDPGGRTVFAGVAPASMRGRAVSPTAKARLRATCPSGQAVSLDLGELNAGGQYSMWLMEPAGRRISFMSVNAIAPYLR